MVTNLPQQPLDLPEWNTPSTSALQSPSIPAPLSISTESHRTKKPALNHSTSLSSHPSSRPPVPKTRWKSGSAPSNKPANTITAPIDLSIAEDDQYGSGNAGGRAGSHGSTIGARSLSIGERSPRLERVSSGGSTKKGVGSPVENADLLYEYFPLSLDDWYVILAPSLNLSALE